MTVLETIKESGSNASSFIKDNIGVIGAGVGGVALGSAVGLFAGSKASVPKKRAAAKSKHRRSRKVSHRKTGTHRRTSKRRSKVTKRTSHRRIHRTKNGQPYIILASGKARFIKKSSARSSRKKKGGRY